MRRPPALVRLAAVAVLVAAWLLGAASPAAAHPALVSSSPGAGYAVTQSPSQAVLAFNEPVSLPARPLAVRGADGTAVDLQVSTGRGGTELVGTPKAALPVGAYEVTYRVVGQDGDLISGELAFGVATPVGAAGDTVGADGARAGPESVPATTVLLRGLLFLGVALALGGAYLAWRVDAATGGLPGVRPLMRSGAGLALLAAVGLLAQLGGAGGLVDSATASGVGRLLGLQAVLLAAAAAVGAGGRRELLTGPLLLLVLALEGLRAHPGEVSGLLGAALTVTHFLTGALWLGGLVHVLRLASAWRGRPKAVRVAAQTYARSALMLFVLVTATGTVSAVTLLPEVDDWTGTTYGRLLSLKIVLFLGVVGMAVAARARLRRTTRTPVDSPTGVARPFRRPAVVETALLAAVVLAAAAVTTVTPARLVPVSSLLAAPVGPTVRTAERVRQVSVSVVASQGRVEIRSYVPDAGRDSAVRVAGWVSTGPGSRSVWT